MLPRRRTMGRMPFAPATRYPADPRAVFVLGMCVTSGVGQLIVAGTPASLEEELPVWGIAVWGALLLVGSVVTLAGMARQTNGGIIAEQIGSAVVGVATLFYIGVAILALRWDAVSMPFGLVLGWGLSCFWRWGQLQSLIQQNLRTRRLVELEERVRARVSEEQGRGV